MKTCWLQYLLWVIIASLGVASALSACGQKGSLYRPAQQAAPAVADAPEIGSANDNTSVKPSTSSTSTKP